MFSRLHVRTKLLVMLLPAAVGLCGLAGLGVQTRLAERADAREARDMAQVAVAATSFVHRVQLERITDATAAAVPSAALDSMLGDQRTATDQAGAALVEAIGRGAGATTGESAEDLTTLRQSVAQIQVVREARSAADRTDGYTDLVHLSLAAVGRLELTQGDREAAGRRWLSAAIEAETDAAARAAALFDTEAPTATREAAADAAQDLLVQSRSMFGTFGEYASTAAVQGLQDARASIGNTSSKEIFDLLAEPGAAQAIDGSTVVPESWPGLVRARLEAVARVEDVSFRADLVRLDQAAADADSAVVYFAAGALGSILGVLLLAFGVSRQLTVALGRLSAAAREISDEQVPLLVANLRSGSGLVGVRFTEVDTGSSDELAAVADALNGLGRAMEEVATEQQQSLRKGISDIFVNLARRNQTLLDRQIQFIDRLESNEEDPDQLEHLFHLDHLATRMRRNAESLLVLAGAEAPRRRARPVDVGDVIRVAVGEVEDFSRIALLGVTDAEVAGATAVDLAHLLAELMENGAQYSPPERTVDVVGHRLADGSYVVTIADHGVGMAAERIDAANRLLASPPPVGLALSRSLGFVVAGTLAQRHGIRVRLSAAPDGGTIAEVTVPPAHVAAPAAEAAPVANGAATTGTAATGAAPVAGGWTADGEYVSAGDGAPATSAVAGASTDPFADTFGDIVWEPDRLPEGPAPVKLTEILPEGPAFEQGLYSLLGRDTPPADPPAAPTAPQAPAINWVSEPGPVAETGDPSLADLPAPTGSPLPFVVAEPLPPAPSGPEAGTAGTTGVTAAALPGIMWAQPIAHPRAPDAADAPGVAEAHPRPPVPGSTGALPSGPPTDAAPLPQRRRPAAASTAAGPGTGSPAGPATAGPAAAAPSGEPTAHIVGTTRSADEVRSTLARFRSGRETGRTGSVDPGTPPPYVPPEPDHDHTSDPSAGGANQP